MFADSPRRRAEKLAHEIAEISPPEPDPEEQRRETEEFLNGWASDIVRAAHQARERRERGEARYRPIGEGSGQDIMAEAVSYNGAVPPADVRAALHDLLTRDDFPEGFDPEMVPLWNAVTREVLRRAFVIYAQEVDGPGAGE